MKRRLISIILAVMFCLLLFPTAAFGAVKPLPSGIADDELENRIKAYIEKHKDTTAAVSLAVFRGQETLYKTAYGYANIENGLAVDDETVYEWGSVSKLLVWVSVMQLWEQGRIELETDVREFLPEGFLSRLKYDAPITMLNLMNHNAGWQDTVFQMCAADADSVLPLGDALKATEPAQIYKPGTVCAYSNWGAALAGYIVERVSGQAFYEYVQDNIFKPLGMEHSALSPTFSDDAWVLSKLQEAEGYTSELLPIGDGLFYMNLYPAGSAAGTLDDFLAFARALVPGSDGAARLFRKSETHAELFSPTLRYPATDIDFVCHGFWSQEYNVQTLGHGGNTNMYSSTLMLDPRSGVGMVVMTNQGGEIVYNMGLPKLAFGELAQMIPEDEGSDISRMAGVYYFARTIRQGMGKMYTLFGLRPLLDDGDGNLKTSLFSIVEAEARQIAADTLILTQRAGGVDVDTLARYSESNGTKRMSSLYGDMLEADADVWTSIIAVILLVIAVLWSAAVLIIGFIWFVLRKLKRQGRKRDAFNKYQLILCIAPLLLVANILSVAGIMLSEEGTAATLLPNIITSIVLGLIPLAYAVLLAVKWPGLVCGKMQKAAYVITLCMGLVMTFNVLALELYRL